MGYIAVEMKRERERERNIVGYRRFREGCRDRERERDGGREKQK